MVFFRNTRKKLEEESYERQRLARQLAEQEHRERRERLHMEETRRRTEEAHQQNMAQIRENLENSRIALLEREREERERRQVEAQKIEIENRRLEREARQRQERQRKIQEASPETLRTLRQLIREKYRLDVEIWSLRGVRKPDRWLVEQKMDKADAAVQEIMAMVGAWEDNRDGSWSPEEWERIQEIRSRLQNGGMRIWAENPVWSGARDSGFYGR